MNGPKKNAEMKLKSFPLNPLSKLIQRKDGIPTRELFALSNAATLAKQLKHASGLKTKITEYMNDCL